MVEEIVVARVDDAYVSSLASVAPADVETMAEAWSDALPDDLDHRTAAWALGNLAPLARQAQDQGWAMYEWMCT